MNAVLLPLLRDRSQSLEDSRSTGEGEPAASCKSDRKEGSDRSVRKKYQVTEKPDKANERFAHG